MSSSVLFWYLRISRSATVPGRKRCGFFTPPVAGAYCRTALVASCFLDALPPVDLRAVCFVRAITGDWAGEKGELLLSCLKWRWGSGFAAVGEWGEKRRYFAAVGELRGHRGGRRGVENFGAGWGSGWTGAVGSRGNGGLRLIWQALTRIAIRGW
ncbi:unnamed protein product [Miscanthus lutarioriparius]|uniref:Uncharacterized protein n=1 Tax=Miscanthus lutarioriparius TaxID=422564 RepID=A0A811Q7T2_9POAL|nr:unnamed protein product [Miscanthus lutarioriparius]